MATTNGLIRTADRTVGVKQDMDEAIQILTPSDVPLQQWLPTDTTTSIKVEWMEEDLSPQTITVSAVSGTASPWTLTVNDAGVVRPGDVLHLVGAAYDRQFLVSSINTTSNEVVVTSFAATTDSNDPAAADVLEIIGQYRTEGGDPEDARSVERTAKYNYTQWGQEKVEVTRTQRKRAMFGGGDPYDHELMKKFKELAIRYERSLVNGYRVESSDKTKRFMGGLFYFISNNSASNTAANVKTAINSLLRSCYEDGGTPGVLMVSPAVKAAIDANIDPSLRRSTRAETTGGYTIEKVLTSFGEVDVVINRHFPTTKGLALQREYLSRVNFDGYFHEALAKTGDSDEGQVVGEFTCRVKNEKAHGILTVTDAS